MKRLFAILLLFYCVCLSQYSYAQNKDMLVKTIQSECETIDADSGYLIKVLKNDDLPLGEKAQGGREITGYFKNNTLYKIIDVVGLPSGIATSTYYFWGDHLVYDYETEDTFPFVDSINRYDYTSVTRSFEGFYYYVADKQIEMKVTGKKKFTNARRLVENIQGLQKEYLSLFANQQ